MQHVIVHAKLSVSDLVIRVIKNGGLQTADHFLRFRAKHIANRCKIRPRHRHCGIKAERLFIKLLCLRIFLLLLMAAPCKETRPCSDRGVLRSIIQAFENGDRLCIFVLLPKSNRADKKLPFLFTAVEGAIHKALRQLFIPLSILFRNLWDKGCKEAEKRHHGAPCRSGGVRLSCCGRNNQNSQRRREQD